MRIKPSTKIQAMLRIHPQLEEVLEDHDLDLEEISAMSIRKACGTADLDVEEVLEDLKASLRDSATEGWLVGDDDSAADGDSEDDYEDEDEEDDYYKKDDTPAAAADSVEEEDDDEDWED
ncbi:MAG: hypothetical protein ACI8RZ_006245 [Myxococcota bacterium]|jgi:hypothetical protein